MKHKLMMTRKFEEKNLMYKPFRIYSVNIAFTAVQDSLSLTYEFSKSQISYTVSTLLCKVRNSRLL